MDKNKAVGLDNLSGKFLPDYKTAKLKLLFKNGSKTTPKNYRLISLLPLVSKIIEKVIHDQKQTFLDMHNII